MKKSLISKFKYELCFFFVFMTELLIKAPRPDEMTGWRTTLYGVTYEYGFIERAFIGSVYRLFIDYLTTPQLYLSVLAVLVILSALIACCLGKMIKRSSDETRFAVTAIVILYIVSPLSVTKFFYARNFASYDIFLMLTAWLCALCALKKKSLWLLLPLAFVGLSVHHMFAFTYYMLIFGALLYHTVKSGFKKGVTAFSAVTVISSVVLFLYYQYIGNSVPFSSQEEIVADVSSKTDIPIEPEVLSRYFMSAKEYFVKWCLTGIEGRSLDLLDRFLALLFTLLLLSPMIAVFIKLWVKCIKKSDNKWEKLCFIFFMFSPLLAIPLFVMAIDWDRWMMGILTAQMSFIMMLVCNKDEVFLDALSEMSEWFKKYRIICVAYLIVLAVLRLSPVEFSIGNFGKEILREVWKY